MNIIDLGILAVILISVLTGMHNGFIVTVFKIAAYFLSWLCSFIFYPIFSKSLLNNSKLLEKVVYYTTASSKIASIEDKILNVANMTKEQIINFVQAAELPHPFDSILVSNIMNHTFNNVETMGDYFDYTIAYVIINIIGFIVVFFAVRFVFVILISILSSFTNLPVLKQMDGLAGAGFGLLRGVLILYVLFAFLPIALAIVPADGIMTLIDKSILAKFFYETNIFTGIIKGFS